MSSPPALDFPSSDFEDVVMNDGTNNTNAQTQSMPEAPQRDPLFLAGTPSVNGSPARRLYDQSSPLRGATARRALGMSTPKKNPLFARTISVFRLYQPSNRVPVASSSPMAFPSSPLKTPQRRPMPHSDHLLDSDPLDFPSYSLFFLLASIYSLFL